MTNIDCNTLNKKFLSQVRYTHTCRHKLEGKKKKLLFVEYQLLNVQGKTELANHHLASASVFADAGRHHQWLPAGEEGVCMLPKCQRQVIYNGKGKSAPKQCSSLAFAT